MNYLDSLEESVRNFCNNTGKSFEAVMCLLSNSEEDFSELLINNKGHTEVITIDCFKRGTVLLCSNHGLLKLS